MKYLFCYFRFDLKSGILRRAFSFIELQIALVILAIGLLSFAGLYRVYSRQTDYIEPNGFSTATYYVVSQSNCWMRKLAAPAQMELTAGQLAWTPDVTEADRNSQVAFTSEPSEIFDADRIIVNVETGHGH